VGASDPPLTPGLRGCLKQECCAVGTCSPSRGSGVPGTSRYGRCWPHPARGVTARPVTDRPERSLRCAPIPRATSLSTTLSPSGDSIRQKLICDLPIRGSTARRRRTCAAWTLPFHQGPVLRRISEQRRRRPATHPGQARSQAPAACGGSSLCPAVGPAKRALIFLPEMGSRPGHPDRVRRGTRRGRDSLVQRRMGAG
jgi:hypothetical protein